MLVKIKKNQVCQMPSLNPLSFLRGHERKTKLDPSFLGGHKGDMEEKEHLLTS
jgi:hypothetical protein